MIGKIIVIVALVAASVGALKMYGVITTPDTQCTTMHTVSYAKPPEPQSAQDFFNTGNYLYDKGECVQAIVAYSEAIQKDSTFAQAYNNKAYTEMRMRNYKDALADVNAALAIDPNYVTALMNRGDIYNYYYAIDKQKALADYHTVVSLGKEKDKSGSVCGHIAMAQTNNVIPLAILKAITTTTCK